MLKQRPTLYFVRIFALFFLLFFAVRLILLLMYGDEFAELTLWQTIYAFAKGAFFMDSSITMVFLGIPMLITYSGWKLAVSSGYLRLFGWYSFVLLLLFTFLAGGDLLYFGIVHRHAGHEVGAALRSSGLAMVEMIATAYWLHLLGFIVAVYGAIRLWAKYMMPPRDIEGMRMGWRRIPYAFIMFLLILLVMRGGIDSKPIQAIFAYNEGSMAQGHLTLNGAFSVLHSLEKSKMMTPDFMPMAEAKAVADLNCDSEFLLTPDSNYPFMREQTSRFLGQDKKNVVVLLLESWDYEFLDATRKLQEKEPYGVTPNYDALVKQGRLYTNFYANGQRSIDGITSVIAGIPTAPGAGYLGEGIEVNNLGWLGTMAKQQGYQTSFLSGSYRASFYMDKIAPLAGFDTYYGSEDLHTNLHPDAPRPEWGGWDYDLLMSGQKLFEKTSQPFLSVLFSVTTHTPWTLPDKKWKKFEGRSNQEKFLNTIYYTDWVLGEFFKAARQSPYFKDTIFILVGDHVSGNMKQPTLLDQHHLPLLILGPNVEPGLDNRISSQVDIIPTIIDLAGWKSRYAGLGVSLLQECAERSAFFTRDDLVGRIEKDAMVVHNMERVVFAQGDTSRQKDVEHALKAEVQLLIDSLLQNRVMAPQRGE